MFILFKESFQFDPRKYKSVFDAFSDLNDYDGELIAFSDCISDLFSYIPESPYLHRYSYKHFHADVYFIEDCDWYFPEQAFDIKSLSELKSALVDLEFKDRVSVFSSEDLFAQLKECDM